MSNNSTESRHSPLPAGLNAPRYGTMVPKRIFVGGISVNTDESELHDLFSRYGTVTNVKIILDRAGVSKGYGFVTFETDEDAQRAATAGNNIMLRDRRLNIAPAIRKQPLSRVYDPTQSVQPGTILYQNGVPYMYHNGTAFFHPDALTYQYSTPCSYSDFDGSCCYSQHSYIGIPCCVSAISLLPTAGLPVPECEIDLSEPGWKALFFPLSISFFLSSSQCCYFSWCRFLHFSSCRPWCYILAHSHLIHGTTRQTLQATSHPATAHPAYLYPTTLVSLGSGVNPASNESQEYHDPAIVETGSEVGAAMMPSTPTRKQDDSGGTPSSLLASAPTAASLGSFWTKGPSSPSIQHATSTSHEGTTASAQTLLLGTSSSIQTPRRPRELAPRQRRYTAPPETLLSLEDYTEGSERDLPDGPPQPAEPSKHPGSGATWRDCLFGTPPTPCSTRSQCP
nr:uncharacterized protein LOC119165103 [Rhipicephalus microplus]